MAAWPPRSRDPSKTVIRRCAWLESYFQTAATKSHPGEKLFRANVPTLNRRLPHLPRSAGTLDHHQAQSRTTLARRCPVFPAPMVGRLAHYGRARPRHRAARHLVRGGGGAGRNGTLDQPAFATVAALGGSLNGDSWASAETETGESILLSSHVCWPGGHSAGKPPTGSTAFRERRSWSKAAVLGVWPPSPRGPLNGWGGTDAPFRQTAQSVRGV